MLDRYNNILSTSDHQFRFKAKRSTNMCTMVVKEVIDYYVNNGSPVYCTMLDATKAFDRVNYCKLFNTLIERDMPLVTIRLLLNMYTSHVTRVLWNGIYSNSFSVKNGVKQGGIVSPTLFCVYLDGLLGMLNNSKVGCHVGDQCLAAIGYADDLVLLAPTVRAMRALLNICDDFAVEYDVVFNASKSKCVVNKPACGRNTALERIPTSPFRIGGFEIEFVDSWPHLGHVLNKNRDDGIDIEKTRNALCGQINNVLCYFGHLSPVVKLRLIKTFCSSLYGSVLWELDHLSIDSVCCTWRKGLRRVWDVPYRTHCNILPVLCNELPLYDEICKRTANFINSCLSSDCVLVKCLVYRAIYVERMRSPMGRNALTCCMRYGLVDIRNFDRFTVRHWFEGTVTEELLNDVLVLLELIFIRDSSFEVIVNEAPLYSQSDIISFISCICTYVDL